MIRIIFLAMINLLILSSSYSFEVTCEFEEVYMDGSNQQGIFILDNNKLRYQYHNRKLYTLIYDGVQLHAVQNSDIKFYQLVKDQHNVISALKDIFKDYPNFRSNYQYDSQSIIVEMNGNKDFIRRLVLKSEQLNLSIYFQNCNFDEIDHKLFSYKNFINKT
jgi:hypothetical protein|tara:strand:- start:684 stop:1169 length:486 start_codon:yes stop_codon:yes gene_type:complete